MTRQQEVLAHLGGALLAAQIVERFVALMLDSSSARSDKRSLKSFVAKSKRARSALLAKALRNLQEDEATVTEIDTKLRRFLKDRNKLVHSFQDLGSWNFRQDGDCDSCVAVLREFIDRAASLQHLFVSAMSVREVRLKFRVSKADADRYTSDYRTVYQPLAIRWMERVSA